MLKWMFLVVLIISGGILAYLYINIKNIETQPITATSSSLGAILVTHSFKDGVHRFSGEIKLPHSCYAVDAETVRNKEVENALVIEITTTDHMLDQRICAQFATRYQFQTITEAPDNSTFTLEIDGKEQRIRVRDVDWNNANDTLVTPH